MNKALLIIDLQNDYFPEGKFPLWNTEQVLGNIKQLIAKAQQQGMKIIHIQHVADSSYGIAPFFNEGTSGVEIHPQILQSVPNGEVVIKKFADSFYNTNLSDVLAKSQIDELLICGMMTQNCVTHTAISKSAEKYKVSVVADCCTTVDEMLHNIALHALSTRVDLISVANI
ncbi:MAG: cysteine hydrolase [Proteobacteria bacterium]|nr:MAG: cysteine hydrolase [Pseudomonadota bacterium]